MEDLQATAAIVGAGKTLLDSLDFIRGISDSSVVSAYFTWDGTMIGGGDKINVIRQAEGEYEDGETPPENNGIWWFHVEEVHDYAFVRMPRSAFLA